MLTRLFALANSTNLEKESLPAMYAALRPPLERASKLEANKLIISTISFIFNAGKKENNFESWGMRNIVRWFKPSLK